ASLARRGPGTASRRPATATRSPASRGRRLAAARPWAQASTCLPRTRRSTRTAPATSCGSPTSVAVPAHDPTTGGWSPDHERTASADVSSPAPAISTTVQRPARPAAHTATGVEELGRTEEAPGRQRLVNVWHGEGAIPAVARRFIKPHMLRWTDRAVWDEGGWTCEWNQETAFFTDRVCCSGTNRYVEVEP